MTVIVPLRGQRSRSQHRRAELRLDRGQGRSERHERRRRRRTAVLVTGAVLATVAVGSAGTRPDSPWFVRLAKPDWYPPRQAFPIAWTALYATIAWAGTRALNQASPDERDQVAVALAQNLALNAVWPWTFFRAERTELGLAGILALDVSTVRLLGHVARVDAGATALLLPYAAWTAFATVLTEELWYRNA